MRKCLKCNVFKEENNFYKNKHKANGLEVYCKDCEKARKKIYSRSNKEKLNNNSLKYYYKHREEILLRIRKSVLSSMPNQNIFKARRGCNLKNEKEISYSALHTWFHRNYKKPEKCEDCGLIGVLEKNGTKWNVQWANISGEYKRDRDDWRHLCRRCHKKFDKLKKLNNSLFGITGVKE